MSRQRNSNRLYTGLVKNIMKGHVAKLYGAPRQIVKKIAVRLHDGPMDNETLYMGDVSCTLPFTFNGQRERYVERRWCKL